MHLAQLRLNKKKCKDNSKRVKNTRGYVKMDFLFKPIVRCFRQFLLKKFVENDDIRMDSSITHIKKQIGSFMKQLNVPAHMNNSKT